MFIYLLYATIAKTLGKSESVVTVPLYGPELLETYAFYTRAHHNTHIYVALVLLFEQFVSLLFCGLWLSTLRTLPSYEPIYPSSSDIDLKAVAILCASIITDILMTLGLCVVCGFLSTAGIICISGLCMALHLWHMNNREARQLSNRVVLRGFLQTVLFLFRLLAFIANLKLLASANHVPTVVYVLVALQQFFSYCRFLTPLLKLWSVSEYSVDILDVLAEFAAKVTFVVCFSIFLFSS